MKVSPLATQDEIQEAIRSRSAEVFRALSRAMKAAGVKHSLREYREEVVWAKDSSHYIDLTGTGVMVSVVPERRHLRWNGKLRVSVHGFRETKQFPERKDGFDYEAIAQHVKGEIQYVHEQGQRQLRDQAERELVDAVHDKLRLDYPGLYDDLGRFVSVENKYGKLDGFQVVIRGLDEQKLRAVVDALRGVDFLWKRDE